MTKFRMNYLEYLFLFFIGLFTLFAAYRVESKITALYDRIDGLEQKIDSLQAKR